MVKCDWCYRKTRAIVRVKVPHLLNPKKFLEADLCGRHKFEIAEAITKSRGSKILKIYDKEKFKEIVEKIRKQYKWVDILLEMGE